MDNLPIRIAVAGLPSLQYCLAATQSIGDDLFSNRKSPDFANIQFFQRKDVNGQLLPQQNSWVALPQLMTQIHVTGNDTMQIAETAKFLIEQLGGEKAVISIETHPAGDGIRNNEDVSIRFAAWDKQPHRDEINLEITGLTAGYNGTGPRNLLDVLRASGVTEEMLTSEEVQNPRFAEVTRCWKRSATTYSDMNEADVFPLHV